MTAGRKVLTASFIALIAAKLMPLWHLQLPAWHAYIDMDRALALIGFLAAWMREARPDATTVRRSLALFFGGLGVLLATLAIAWSAGFVPSHFLVKFAILYFMTALVEEIIFRGFLAEWMIGRWGVVRAALGSSAVFALVHPAAYVYPVYGGLVFLTGLLCFIFYWRFRRTHDVAEGVAAATFAHATVILLGMMAGII
ncbi:CPBP family intramembrane glutamic endopeptidase [Sulfurivirga sp.]|uniref:CPBP family intramembrane glutamic endopeptidase n=1 Tax=Sulfurivirga sp. TaxID=2614236 RepID=UPI0025E07682|nr:CPBP family intramembrane glutamic endopeptidase [Sulfurivirga sp.]